MKRLVLIDGHAILHRAYHAFPPSLRTRKGEIVNAVYGFTRILLTVLKDLQPEYVAVAFDLPVPTFRHKEYVGYQAQRPEMEKELKTQIERVWEVVKALNIPVFTAPGFEADDIIGTLTQQVCRKFQKPNSQFQIEVIIVTGDRDIMQLVREGVKVYAPGKGFSQAEIFDRKKVKEVLGIWPEQIVDYKALVGDASDNYPGVPGIGPKTAVKLLNQFGTLKNIYKNLKKIAASVAQKLEKGKESAELSKKLATIVTNAPVKLNLKTCQLKDYDPQAVRRVFEELEFRSLLNKLPRSEGKEEKKREGEQIKLF
ncbi:MAG: 5'-3' exonuclease [Microgenomates group bacterium]